jgi:hypothetical protein
LVFRKRAELKNIWTPVSLMKQAACDGNSNQNQRQENLSASDFDVPEALNRIGATTLV